MILSTAVEKRKNYLIHELNKLGIYQTRDGRQLKMLGLADLEWIHIEKRCEFAKAYSEGERNCQRVKDVAGS